MPPKKKEPSGCGCASIPFSVILLILGGGYWLVAHADWRQIVQLLPSNLTDRIPVFNLSLPETLTFIPGLNSPNEQPQQSDVPPSPIIPPKPPNPQPQQSDVPPTPIIPAKPPQPQPTQQPLSPVAASNVTASSPKTPWEQKGIRAIYLSRYQVTNRASEQMIRERVRYYRDRGINTIIHGVWGNACTMYKSQVMQQKFGYDSCPNEFQDKWLDWLIDEAHKQGMQVHAYFEKGIKIDEDSPLFDLAIERGWIVPGVDRTHPGVEHYVLNVEIPEVAKYFPDILVEFVKKYPKIDAVQWDDYLGDYAELPGKVDRTAKLTSFVQNMIKSMKAANPKVSFDICHHNPYWAKRYFAADWENWGVDRVFIQVYADENFAEEMKYVEIYDGISITERQFNRLEELIKNDKIKNILFFPLTGDPAKMADNVKSITSKIK